MQTELRPADEAGIQMAARLLQQGDLVALPTETVYGIAADATKEESVRKIFEAKGRPQDNPLIVHIENMQMLEGLVSSVPERAEALAKTFWPGPLTMIMPRGPRLCNAVCGGLNTVGIRMPSHPVVQAVIRQSGVAFAAPSANLSGSPSPTNAADVYADMNGRLPLILDGGECAVGVESTVLDITGEKPVLLRPGYVTAEQIEEVLGEPVVLAGAITRKLQEGETARSPGMKYKHYAPRAEVTILKGSLQDFAAYVKQHAGPDTWCLCFEGEQDQLSVPCVPYGVKEDDASQARELFSALRRLDDAGAKTVYARCPNTTGVALAVYNRLIRAAAFREVEV